MIKGAFVMNFSSISTTKVPTVTTDEMREVDRLMVEEYGVQIIQMMENAGRNLAELSTEYLGGSLAKKKIVVAAGVGNNGGGGITAARHLSNWGANVSVLAPTDNFKGVAKIQWDILKKLPVYIKIGEEALGFLSNCNCDMVIDALIGYGLSGKPRGWTADCISIINRRDVTVVALDVPSGLNATTGEIEGMCVRATLTLTLALPKIGLVSPKAKRVTGDIYLADIGVPSVFYREIGIDVKPIFEKDTIIKLIP